MTHDQLTAYARAAVTLTLGVLPFLAIGYWGSWPIAGAVYAVGAAAAWWFVTRLRLW